MMKIQIANTEIVTQQKDIAGQFVEIKGEKFYRISNYSQMPDFFMSIVSENDLWMYLSSNGALTAGRKNRDNALFPYYTEDKIHDFRGKTGSYTVVLAKKNNKTFLWEPFSELAEKVYNIERNIFKSIYGNKVIFEEINSALGLCFRYGWYNSDKFGWVKKSVIQNTSSSMVTVEILDGIRNIIPYGVDHAFQNEYSNLLDAYKKNELLAYSNIGLFMLSSIPIDRAEPSEALKATTVWPVVPDGDVRILISDRQLENFRKGQQIKTESDVRAARGTYYVNVSYELINNDSKEWYLVAEVNQDAKDVANLNQFIQTEKNLAETLINDINAGTQKLIKIVGNADGLQVGNEEPGIARHFSNTLFNIMRGGIFANGYNIKISDFKLYLKQCNKAIEKQFANELAEMPDEIHRITLLKRAKQTGNPDFERICMEYLPLTFSRRHGDPSRPWNQFSIETKNNDGTDKLSYQGNWRDIFQNWEALCISYPGYIEGIIARFLNASTPDGYNPYRITREGMDWECPNPDDPWSYIGYWGDHQIIYLLKFLEQAEAYQPGKLDELLTKEVFVYANVPYRIKPFDEMVANPKETIHFDANLNKEIDELAKQKGADGKLVHGWDGTIYRVNLMEKMLATLLSKLSNFIPEAGIWLNTQRPEWNDANNALVGNGVSMVTLYYIRRFLNFWQNKIKGMEKDSFEVSVEMKAFFDKMLDVFINSIEFTNVGFTNEIRFLVASKLGAAGTEYRETVYSSGFSGKKETVSTGSIKTFIDFALKLVDQSIQKNKRDDGMYHAYNLLSFNKKSITIRHLYEMLEGQVAVLSSGKLNAAESLGVLDALKASKLFRADQYSYILYPDRQLPRFEDKNNISDEKIARSVLLQKLLADGETSVISRDNKGVCLFNGEFRNSGVLSAAIDELKSKKYSELTPEEKETVLAIYEEMFDHQSFTGRSGTFFGYEGLGSIYWHMVSKLLLAVQECYFAAINEGASNEITRRLKQHYYEIKAGIGLYKSPGLYGAFPTDAYSHTPAHAGAKQPGLTGQVKEDIISRFSELGIMVRKGAIVFDTSLLNPAEFLQNPGTFSFINLKGEEQNLILDAKQLAFTFCQVPVVYTSGEKEIIRIIYSDGAVQKIEGNSLDLATSSLIFERSGKIARIEYVKK